MFIRKRAYIQLERERAAALADRERLWEQITSLRADYRELQKQNARLLSTLIEMKHQGFASGPPPDESWGRYSIDEIERERMVEIKPMRQAPEPDSPKTETDLIEKEIEADLEAALGQF